VNVPKHDNATTLYKLVRHQDSIWVESLLEFLSENSKGNKDSAKWLATNFDKQCKEELSVVAKTMSFGLNIKISAVNFHAMSTAIHANVSQQGGIKRHINDFFGRSMFEVDKDLKANVAKKVVEPVTGTMGYIKPV
jgi:hypothetical protein